MLKKNGNVLLIVLVVVSVTFIAGFYLKTKGGTNLKNKVTASVAEEEKVTSEKMTMSVTGDASGLISGKTSAYAEVFINDKETKADANGNFSLLMPLDLGENTFVVSANDSDGNVTEETITINSD